MAFESQSGSDLLFVDWGKLGVTKDGIEHDPETNIVVKEGEALIGKVATIKETDKGGKYFYILEGVSRVDKKDKELEVYEKNVYVGGNSSLNKQFLEDDREDFIPVKDGDLVRIRYIGMYKTKKGGTGYGMDVAVDRS